MSQLTPRASDVSKTAADDAYPPKDEKMGIKNEPFLVFDSANSPQKVKLRGIATRR